MRSPAVLAVSAALAAAVSLSACGAAGTSSSTKEFTGPKQDVAQAIDDLKTDAKRHDASKICTDLLATETLNRLKAANIDCASALKKAVDEASSYDLEVQSVTIRGDRATARVKDKAAGKTSIDTFTLVKEGGSWKIVGLGG